jgi:hypothetical protein
MSAVPGQAAPIDAPMTGGDQRRAEEQQMSRMNRALGAALLSGALSGGGLLAVPAPAHAQDHTAIASGSLGHARIEVAGLAFAQDAIATCASDGPEDNSSTEVEIGPDITFDGGTTVCGRAADGTASAEVAGERFETTVLRQFGGPALRLRSYVASCTTTENGSSGYIQLGGAGGFELPEQIPANHVITVPGLEEGDAPMARIVLNELVAPSPPDGSLTTNAMHVTLFPEGGPASGDIVVGTAACDPTAADR